MASLAEELQTQLSSLDQAIDLSMRVLGFIPNLISDYSDKRGYRIYSSQTGGTLKYVRPIRVSMFYFDPSEMLEASTEFKVILKKLSTNETFFSEQDKAIIDRVVYTIQQSLSAGMDLLINSNAAKKHVGNRFEELLRFIFTEAGITNSHETLSIPYGDPANPDIYKCENDIILSPYKSVRSSNSGLDPNEIVVSLKTSSKDRMGKIFIDKMLLENFVKHDQPVIGIFLNDVQRKGSDNISFTLVSGLFMVYTQFLIKLNGVYYLDMPPNALVKPWSDHIKPFSELLTNDIRTLLAT